MGTARTVQRGRRFRFRISIVVAVAIFGLVLAPSTAWAAVYGQQQKLTASVPTAGDEFGGVTALSADGNTALVGAPGVKDVATGAAYVFTRSGGPWSLQAELTASDAVAGDNFGIAVALSGDGNTILIGAPHADNSCAPGFCEAGAVYVFTRSGSTCTKQQDSRSQTLSGASSLDSRWR
jgi:hypothetical protein